MRKLLFVQKPFKSAARGLCVPLVRSPAQVFIRPQNFFIRFRKLRIREKRGDPNAGVPRKFTDDSFGILPFPVLSSPLPPSPLSGLAGSGQRKFRKRRPQLCGNLTR